MLFIIGLILSAGINCKEGDFLSIYVQELVG